MTRTMTTALFPGSFDPITYGHIDLISRALNTVDELVIAVGINPSKRGWLPAEQRVEIIEEALREVLAPEAASRARVLAFEGLVVDCAKEIGANFLIKGIRNAADFDSEFTQATVNRQIAGIETLLLPSAHEWQYLSSSVVREIFTFGSDVSRYVPAAVLRSLGDENPQRSG